MTTARTRVELYTAIRRDARAGLSEREIQRQHHVGWRTVKAALSSAWPAERAAYPARTSKLAPFKPVIDQILVADLDATASTGIRPRGSSPGSSTSTR